MNILKKDTSEIISIRVPTQMLSEIEALAPIADTSRSEIMRRLLEKGLESARGELAQQAL